MHSSFAVPVAAYRRLSRAQIAAAGPGCGIGDHDFNVMLRHICRNGMRLVGGSGGRCKGQGVLLCRLISRRVKEAAPPDLGSHLDHLCEYLFVSNQFLLQLLGVGLGGLEFFHGSL